MIAENIVLVGGTGGIGAPTARKYASLENNVIVGARKKTSLADENNIDFIPVDVLNLDSILDFTEKVKDKYGTISHLVNLTGGALYDEVKFFKDVKMETIAESVHYNLTSQLQIVRSFLPMLVENKTYNKSITLISSTNALKGASPAIYAASKAGLHGLVKGTTVDVGHFNIRINAIVPGSVLTEKTRGYIESKKVEHKAPMYRVTTAEECANSIYAVTHLMTSVTGQIIVVDAGQSCK